MLLDSSSNYWTLTHSRISQYSFLLTYMAVDIKGATVDGRYYVENKIQSGFYGATWLSKDLHNGSIDVCLKVTCLPMYHTTL